MFDKLAQCSGFQMYVNPNDDNVSQELFAGNYYPKGVWEPESSLLVRESLRSGDVFVDCGANIGYYTCLAASLGAKVIAFEPSPTHFGYLNENVRLNNFTNVITLPFALWNEQKQLCINEPKSGNVADTKVGEPISGLPATIQAYTLDQILYPNSVDFIKTDCQGSDYRVLMGANRLIRESVRPMKFLLERGFGIDLQIKELGLSIIKSIGSEQNVFCSRN